MKGIKIFNKDGRILTSKMIDEIRKITKNNNEANVILIIEGGVLKKG